MFSTPLDVRVFFHTPESESMVGAGMDFDPNYSETRTVMFCSITGIYPHKIGAAYYGAIMANGTEFITTLSFEELEERVLKAW